VHEVIEEGPLALLGQAAWSSYHLLFTGETSSLRRAHGFSRPFLSWRSF
jgi:hypothetical protein